MQRSECLLRLTSKYAKMHCKRSFISPSYRIFFWNLSVFFKIDLKSAIKLLLRLYVHHLSAVSHRTRTIDIEFFLLFIWQYRKKFYTKQALNLHTTWVLLQNLVSKMEYFFNTQNCQPNFFCSKFSEQLILRQGQDWG